MARDRKKAPQTFFDNDPDVEWHRIEHGKRRPGDAAGRKFSSPADLEGCFLALRIAKGACDEIPGMIGLAPAFRTKEEAEAYAADKADVVEVHKNMGTLVSRGSGT
jgi:hypothetical protein